MRAGSMLTRRLHALATVPRRRLPRYYRADEVKRIVEACEEHGRRHMALLIDFLWKTGLRASEALKVTFGDLDPYARTVRVTTLKKSGPAERVIPIPDDLVSRIQTARIERGATNRDRIFPFSRFTLFRRVRAACRLAGLDDGRAHPHCLRHSCAIHLLMNGVPVAAVQRILGHDSLRSTAIYLAIVQEDIEPYVRSVKW